MLRGKSNLVKLLRFMNALVTAGDVARAVNLVGYGNVSDVAYGRRPETRVSVTLEVLLDQDYVYSVSFRARDGRVEAEELRAGGETLFKREDTLVEYLKEGGSRSRATVSLGQPALRLISGLADASPLIGKLVDFIGKWAFYNFSPTAIRGSSPVGASERLAYDGRNLSQVLHTLLTTRRREFNRVEELLRAAVPEVEELLTLVTGTSVRVAVRERGFEEPFGPEHLSDGTLRLLAFITALALPNPLVSFEEPENRVHPELLGALVELMRLSGKQVIVTTHSPSLLDYFKPEEVYLVAKIEGETRIKRLSTMEDINVVKRFIDRGGGLGEAWVSGLLESEY